MFALLAPEHAVRYLGGCQEGLLPVASRSSCPGRRGPASPDVCDEERVPSKHTRAAGRLRHGSWPGGCWTGGQGASSPSLSVSGDPAHFTRRSRGTRRQEQPLQRQGTGLARAARAARHTCARSWSPCGLGWPKPTSASGLKESFVGRALPPFSYSLDLCSDFLVTFPGTIAFSYKLN